MQLVVFFNILAIFHGYIYKPDLKTNRRSKVNYKFPTEKEFVKCSCKPI